MGGASGSGLPNFTGFRDLEKRSLLVVGPCERPALEACRSPCRHHSPGFKVVYGLWFGFFGVQGIGRVQEIHRDDYGTSGL